MKKQALVVLIGMFTLGVNAQTKKEKDQKAIKEMCGCYEVDFKFAETFSYSKDPTYQASKVKHNKGLEWVQLVEDEPNKIVMQHLLIVGKPTAPSIIKHWRQDWVFENTQLYLFEGTNKWKFVQKPEIEVQGQWTQKVYQVDDSPRYEGSATWVHVDGKSYWENTADAPLPRREYTIRRDYDVMVRTNRHEITPAGWIHDQDNHKVVRQVGKEDVILAQEKGVNTYVKVADSKCTSAQDWWIENKAKWQLVRKNWEDIFAKNKDLELMDKVADKRLYEHLFGLTPTAKNNEIKNIITYFVK